MSSETRQLVEQMLWRIFHLEPARRRYHAKFVIEPTIERARAIEAKTRRYLDRIHPAGANIIHWQLAELRDVACEGDRAEVERLADTIKRKLTLERLWHLQKLLSKQRHPRLIHRLHGFAREIGG